MVDAWSLVAGSGTVAADNRAARGDGVAASVGVLDDRPAEPVDEVVMVDQTVQVEVLQ